jgi:hypothetical protein
MAEQRLDKDHIEACFGKFLEDSINKKPEWNDEELSTLSNEIPKFILTELSNISRNYKYSVICIISKKFQVNPKVDSGCLWDTQNDIYITISKDSPYYYCLVNIYATFLYS